MSLIVQVNIVLNRTVVVDSDWRFDNLCCSHLQSQWVVSRQLMVVNSLWLWRWLLHRLSKFSHCQQQQSCSALHSCGWSNLTYFWNDSLIQTFHYINNSSYLQVDNWLICRLHAQCMMSKDNVNLLPRKVLHLASFWKWEFFQLWNPKCTNSSILQWL